MARRMPPLVSNHLPAHLDRLGISWGELARRAWTGIVGAEHSPLRDESRNAERHAAAWNRKCTEDARRGADADTHEVAGRLDQRQLPLAPDT